MHVLRRPARPQPDCKSETHGARRTLAQPHEPKFRTLRQQNARLAQCIGPYPAARALLRLLGFREARACAERLDERRHLAGHEHAA